VRRRGVKQVRQGKLMDVAKPLKRSRIEDSTLIRVQTDEDVNRVTNFVEVLAHDTVPWHREAASMARAGML
jgi:hypothetical protein